MGHPASKDPSSLYAQGSTVQYEYTHTRQGHFFSLTHVGTPRLKMSHLAEKLTKGLGILPAKIPLVYMLKAQQFSMSTHTLDRSFLISHTRRDPSTKDESSCREADKRMGHPASKDPSSLYAQGSTVQYEYTHTRQGHFFSLTHVGTPRLKMGHLAEKLTKGWGILPAKIPLVYIKAQQFCMSTHTLDKVISSLSHT